MWVRSLGWEDPLKEGMATHSSILAWRIPWTEEGYMYLFELWFSLGICPVVGVFFVNINVSNVNTYTKMNSKYQYQ